MLHGDVHGDLRPVLRFAEKMELSEKDVVIILGDCGIFWRKDGSDAKSFINFFEENYNFHLYFIDREPRKR